MVFLSLRYLKLSSLDESTVLSDGVWELVFTGREVKVEMHD